MVKTNKYKHSVLAQVFFYNYIKDGKIYSMMRFNKTFVNSQKEIIAYLKQYHSWVVYTDGEIAFILNEVKDIRELKKYNMVD